MANAGLGGLTPLVAPLPFRAGEDLGDYGRRFGYVALDSGNPRVKLSAVGYNVDGVMRYGAEDEAAVTFDSYGVLIVTAGAAVAVGAEVIPDATGRAVTGYYTEERGVGRALQAASAAGEDIEIYFYGPGQVGPVNQAPEEFTTDAQTISVVKSTSLFTSNGTWTATLPAGRFIGQRKTIGNHVDTAGQITVSYTGRNAGAAVTAAVLADAADSLVLEWSGTAWVTVSHTGVTFS